MAANVKMLVVDDDQDMRTSLALQFEAEGFIVDTADDGIPALSMIRQNDYDIILLDLNLPRMNGVTLMKELQQREKLPHVSIQTASNSLLKEIECVKLGAKNYLLKPCDPAELMNVVTKTLNS